jgi:hypothetical protein
MNGIVFEDLAESTRRIAEALEKLVELVVAEAENALDIDDDE